ncbi:bidirectional sugar transporter SWEET11-like [Impatiens glandulifera]|uniref:bidirectional sugar transporter SWEET11-like n=1 Tax=Impatiens glandulifera TaxID=253017 RepID=UPI001FB17731|nr:bidirectional sugar transporter SWEET11-like [Impatiens glandulifera]
MADDVILLITINAFGCLVESIYISIYIFYAPRKATTVGCVIGTLGGFGVIVMLTQVLADNVILLITINAFGCLVESIYIGFYIFYAPRKATSVGCIIGTLGGFGVTVILTQVLATSVGCVIGTLGGFGVIVMLTQVLKQVIQTGSVDFMPLTLTLTLTSFPNILEVSFGVIQMIVYWIYRPASSKNVVATRGVGSVNLPVVVGDNIEEIV